MDIAFSDWLHMLILFLKQRDWVYTPIRRIQMFILCGNKSEGVIMKARFESLRSLFAMYTEGELVTYVSTRKAAQTLLHTYDFRGAHIQLARQCRKVIRSTIGETMREWDSFHSLSEIREQEDKYVNKHLDDFEECPLPLRRYLKERDLLEELQIGPLDAVPLYSVIEEIERDEKEDKTLAKNLWYIAPHYFHLVYEED